MRLRSRSIALSGLMNCSQPRNEQYFCHHREGARSRGAGHVTLQGRQDHRHLSEVVVPMCDVRSWG